MIAVATQWWRLVFHHGCNLSCSAFFVYVFYQQIHTATAEASVPELLLGIACLLFAVVMLFRPFAMDARTDALAVLICGLCKTYYWLFEFSVQSSGLKLLLGSSLVFVSTLLWIVSVVWLGRSFSILPALREIRTTGPYRFVRHPIYFSYVLLDVGLLLSYPSLFNFVVVGFAIGLYVVRINMEESLLGRVEIYNEYSRRTRFRLIPFVY